MSAPNNIGKRSRQRRHPRHVSAPSAESFNGGLKSLAFLAHNGVQVSARIDDLQSGESLLAVDDYVVVPTASLGRVLLLIDVAARLNDASFPALQLLDRSEKDAFEGTGLWQHLQVPSLPVADIATLVGSVGDEVAANVLIRSIGLDSIRRRTESIGLARTALLDQVRERRGPDDAPHVSVGSMRELSWLFSRLARGEVVDSRTSELVTDWLRASTDRSLVASAFALNPKSTTGAGQELSLFNATGGDASTRVEVGVLRGKRSAVSYAVAANLIDPDLRSRLAVADAFRTIGRDILEYVV